MSDIAALIADMVRAGVDPELIGRTAATLAAAGVTTKTARQQRNARYYQRKASEKRLNSDDQDVSDGDVLSPKEIPPTPPKEITPIRSTPNGVSQPSKRAMRLSADWSLPSEWRADAVTAGLPEQLIDLEALKMRDWSRSSKNGAKLDWRATWRNWCREAAARQPSARASPPPLRGLEAVAARVERDIERLRNEQGNGGTAGGDFDADARVPLLARSGY